MRINLYKAKKSGSFRIISTPNNELLKNLGIHVGTEITVRNRYFLGGPVLLHVESAYTVAIGKSLAQQIEVISVAS